MAPTVVLVHGAFGDASNWAGVIRRLHQADVPVQALANPLRGLAHDASAVANAVAAIPGPVVLVGHSYAGAVISAASPQAPNVEALVYIAAFVPDEGESVLDLAGRFPETELGPALRPLKDELYLDEDAYARVLAADLPAEVTSVLAVSQRPIAAAALGEQSGPVGWHTLPSWHTVATADRTIHPDAQRFGAERAGSTVTEIDGSHLIAVSQPDKVTRLVLAAVDKVA